ncbi:hypothetical protein BDP27DRAFT_1426587 [Rhodocollybia butyracea]|uniref:Uncharacterized protein n=1 Tax=Rhodocollybia butyracea TaxID=206335 RepID=A0A9P5PEG8_9AGAR|nr:hypothetical protein BDP27DRAFT_1426587 [Rhodocollybia butyracea]
MQPEPGLLEHAVRSQRNPQTTRVTAPRLQSATTSPSSSRNHETNDFGRTERTRYETPDPSQDYFEPTRLIGQPHPPPNPEHINQLAEASTSSFIRTLNQNASRSQETPNTSSTSHISNVSSTATGDTANTHQLGVIQRIIQNLWSGVRRRSLTQSDWPLFTPTPTIE